MANTSSWRSSIQRRCHLCQVTWLETHSNISLEQIRACLNYSYWSLRLRVHAGSQSATHRRPLNINELGANMRYLSKPQRMLRVLLKMSINLVHLSFHYASQQRWLDHSITQMRLQWFRASSRITSIKMDLPRIKTSRVSLYSGNLTNSHFRSTLRRKWRCKRLRTSRCFRAKDLCWKFSSISSTRSILTCL